MGDLAVADSSVIQKSSLPAGRARRTALAVVAGMALLLSAVLGGLSLLDGKSDGTVAALRHERETALARQLERFSCIQQAKVQLSSRDWHPGAVIILKPSRPEALADAAMLDHMLDVLCLLPEGPEKAQLLVFDTEGHRLYPVTETAATHRQQRARELERQALRAIAPLLGQGRAEVLVRLEDMNGEKGGTERRAVTLLLEESTVPENLRPQLTPLLRQARVLDESRGDTLRLCWLPERREVGKYAFILQGAALGCLALVLACGILLCWKSRGVASVPAGAEEQADQLGKVMTDTADAEEMDRLRQQLSEEVQARPGQGVALLRHWLAQDHTASEGPAGGQRCD